MPKLVQQVVLHGFAGSGNINLEEPGYILAEYLLLGIRG